LPGKDRTPAALPQPVGSRLLASFVPPLLPLSRQQLFPNQPSGALRLLLHSSSND